MTMPLKMGMGGMYGPCRKNPILFHANNEGTDQLVPKHCLIRRIFYLLSRKNDILSCHKQHFENIVSHFSQAGLLYFKTP